MPDWTVIGPKIRQRRDSLGLTQEQAAARSASMVSRATLANLEGGHPTSDPSSRSLGGIARALRWPANWLEKLEAGVELNELVGDVEAAIASDPALNEPARVALLATYTALVGYGNDGEGG